MRVSRTVPVQCCAILVWTKAFFPLTFFSKYMYNCCHEINFKCFKHKMNWKELSSFCCIYALLWTGLNQDVHFPLGYGDVRRIDAYMRVWRIKTWRKTITGTQALTLYILGYLMHVHFWWDEVKSPSHTAGCQTFVLPAQYLMNTLLDIYLILCTGLS